MDRLDQLLTHLPAEAPPPGLARRICGAVQAHRRRVQRARLALSAMLAVGGMWLVVPWIMALVHGVAMPPSGGPVLASWWETAWSGLGSLARALASSVEAFQAGLVASLEVTTWIGLAALAFSALLAFDQVLPHHKKK